MDTHGGEIYDKRVKWDFSVNVNPLGMPERIAAKIQDSLRSSNRYPDDQCLFLRKKLSEHYRSLGIEVLEDQILCTAGASEGIMAVVRALAAGQTRGSCRQERPLTSLLPVPSFSEYERALTLVGAALQFLLLKEKDGFRLTEDVLGQLTEDIDILFLCNPNNPVGNLTDRQLILKILERCKKSHITVLLDQCFLEFAEDWQQYDLTDSLGAFPNLVIVNAFTKTYAMAGLRLGYLISSDTLFLKECKEQLACWSVSIPAQEAGEAALDDTSYMTRSRRLVVRERSYLTAELENMGFFVLPGTADFLCVSVREKEPHIGCLSHAMLERGVLIRDCGNFRGMPEGYYRIAVKTHAENVVLIQTIKECMKVWQKI